MSCTLAGLGPLCVAIAVGVLAAAHELARPAAPEDASVPARAPAREARPDLRAVQRGLARTVRELERVREELVSLRTSRATLPRGELCEVPGPPRVDAVAVDRRALRRTWAMMTGLQRSSRMIVPAVRKGVPIGFVLYAISGLPLLKEMGFTNGDLVRRVAGHTVSGPEEVEDVVRRLDKARAFSVDFCRAGRHQHLVVVLAQE